jgi:hypothetical protein
MAKLSSAELNAARTIAIIDRSVAGDFQRGWRSIQAWTCPFFGWPTGRAPQYAHMSLSRLVVASRWPLLTVPLARPRSQY